MHIWFNRQGQPITMEEANTALQDKEQRVLKKTNFPNGQQVSTVWLGASISGGPLPENLFETMIFGEGPFQGCLTKYDTEQEAFQGHEAWVIELAQEIEKGNDA